MSSFLNVITLQVMHTHSFKDSDVEYSNESCLSLSVLLCPNYYDLLEKLLQLKVAHKGTVIRYLPW